MKLNDAAALYLGSSPVTKAVVGSEVVWPVRQDIVALLIDDGASIVVPHVGGEIVDLGPHQLPVTVNNAPAFTATGPSGEPGTVLANGTSNYWTIPYTSAAMNASSLSVEAWVRIPESHTGRRIIVARGSNPSAFTQRSLYLGVEDGVVYARRYSGNNATILTGLTPLTSDTWHHIAATYTSGTFRVYLDGQIDNSSATTGDINQVTATMYFGAVEQAGPDFDYWEGSLAYFAWYLSALSPSTIAAHYEAM